MDSCDYQPSTALKNAIAFNGGYVTGSVLCLIAFQVCWVLSGLLFTKLVENYDRKYLYFLVAC